MVNIPVRFKRVAAAFDEMSRARSCDSSGSEHSADLSDLVNSFVEREIREQRSDGDDDSDQDRNESEIDDDELESNSQDFELRDSLRKLFDHDDGVRRSILAAVEKALEAAGDQNSPGFKRRMMALLRSNGLDAGLCKSKWERNGRNPSGNYEFVDVNAGGSRFIAEVSLAGEFRIARERASYASLIEEFPRIFVGKPEDLKQVVRQMSKAIRKSLKSVELNMPPWRRLAYMEAKWFGPYKRTTSEVSKAVAFKAMGGNRLVGFAPEKLPTFSLFCRGDFAANSRGRVGNLAAALDQEEMLL